MPTRSCATWSRRRPGRARSSSRTTTGSTSSTAGSATPAVRRRRRCAPSARAACISTSARCSTSATCRSWWRRGASDEEELLVRAAEMLACKERVGLLDDPPPGIGPGREQALLAGPTDGLPRAGAGLGGAAAADAARPGRAADPGRRARCALCVLGPLADQEPEDWLGAYSSHANRHLERVTTPLAGIRRHWPEAVYARGCDYDGRRGAARAATRRRRWPAGRRTSCSSSASRTSGAGSRRRWRSRGCRSSSAGSSSWCAGPTPGRS